MNNKTESLKEKLRQALSSTARVISDDLGINPKKNAPAPAPINRTTGNKKMIKIFFIQILLMLERYWILLDYHKPLFNLPKYFY